MNRRGFLETATRAGGGFAIGGAFLGGMQGGAQAPQKPGGERVVPLDGEWSIAADPKNLGRQQGWSNGYLPDEARVRVPGTIQDAFPEYGGVAWYAREFQAPPDPDAAGRYLLRFEAVSYLADVWVNGVRIGTHEGPETPFTLDATDAITAHGTNRLAVRVLNPTDEPVDGISLGNIPSRGRWGGILAPVCLLLVPAVRIRDLHVRPDWKTGEIRVVAAVTNATRSTEQARLAVSVAPGASGTTLAIESGEHALPPGDTEIRTGITVPNVRPWSLEDPFLYRVTAQLGTLAEASHEVAVRCGFRDFRVVDGYFRLNDRRIFLKCTHGDGCPKVVPPATAPDLLERDMVYAKACGFNMVRFLNGVGTPRQLDLCDEIGLMVYEESAASWHMPDSPRMREQFERCFREVIERDRNHPSVTLWGLLNETREGPVFREAVSFLPTLRSLDDSRLVLLSSGRWDGDLSIGSISNPGSPHWEPAWGEENPGAARSPAIVQIPNSIPARDAAEAAEHRYDESVYALAPHGEGILAYVSGAGDVHCYPSVPQTAQDSRLIRTLGQTGKPVFLSEYGIGSLADTILDARGYEQAGVATGDGGYAAMRKITDLFLADWDRWKLGDVYPFPEDMVRDSQAKSARHRRFGFNLVRSNPKLCGFSLTSIVDGAGNGEGLWRQWRDWKPGIMDALQDGWWPLRWCLFVEPNHGYAGKPLRIEAVLANEDVLRPGEYPARFRICGPSGAVWDRKVNVTIPPSGTKGNGPLAVPVLAEEVTLNGPPGTYRLAATIERGGAPLGREWDFYLSEDTRAQVPERITLWGVETRIERWLVAHGHQCERFSASAPPRREIILVGEPGTESNSPMWQELAKRMARGSAVVFLSHVALRRGKETTGWLPLAEKGRCLKVFDWLYHKECIARAHPWFEGLPGKGILDWYYYGPIIPHHLFEGQPTPDEPAAVAVAPGYIRGSKDPAAYISGILLGAYKFGAGRFVVSTFPVLQQAERHPVADRMLLNAIREAAAFVGPPPADLPADFGNRLHEIGYS